MNKTQTKRLQKLLDLLDTTGLAVRETFRSTDLYGQDTLDLYTSAQADEKGRPTLGALAAKVDKNVRNEPYLSNVGQVAVFFENLGLNNEDSFDLAERVVNASAATHSPVQNAKRAAAAIRRVIARQTVNVNAR